MPAIPPLTPDERQRFLTLYQRSGLIAQSLQAIGRKPAHLRATRAAFPGFAEDMDFCRQLRVEAIEAEIDRRAVIGYEEPVFYRGEQCGTVRKWSDPLLALLIRKEHPGYRESVRVDQSVTAQIDVTTSRAALRALSPEDQDRIREIIVGGQPAALTDGERTEES